MVKYTKLQVCIFTFVHDLLSILCSKLYTTYLILLSISSFFIFKVNCFEIGQHGISIRGLYPKAFLMSHDCVPNTNHTDDSKDYRLTVRASTGIKANQPITLSYAYTLQSTLKRRQHLLENKFFECKCKRCADPTELGTYCGALRCPKCEKGLVLSTDPLNPEAQWSCNNKSEKPGVRCPGYTVTAASMERLMNR